MRFGRPAIFKRRFVIAALVGALVLGVFLIPDVRRQAEAVVFPVTAAFNHAWNWAGSYVKGPKAYRELRDQHERLTTLLTSFLVEKAELDRLREEVTKLQSLLEYRTNKRVTMITAQVIGRDGSQFRELLLLDRGSDHGIREGQAVIAPEGILIGIVEKVTVTGSAVRLLQDPKTRIAARVSGVSKSDGIVMPVEGGAVALRYVSETNLVAQRALVTTSALNVGIPESLVIGTVDLVAKESDTPFLKAILALPIRVDDLDYVGVLVVEADL